MTIRVKVEHMQPGYDKAITVETMYLGADGQFHHHTPPQAVVVEPGKLDEWRYVYGGQALLIMEGPAAQPVAPDTSKDDTRPSDVN